MLEYADIDYLVEDTADLLRESLEGLELLINPWDGAYRYTASLRLHGFPMTAIVSLS